ncbi:hypothetical protein I4641_02650 [Waterburya agarophytonicola K14]|uniref:Uncharacterized protein n=2 Tax=Waterburya TaxID=2886915 RepID=A0A964BND2_9CYAN|nr:bestrophin family ion channel [Waterburya agarophytonicola]MCC0175882.1 hypothetical protein [Waterburya agarophytonicola KI4]
MPLYPRSSKRDRTKSAFKRRKFSRSWKRKFQNYTGEHKNGFQIAWLLQGAITSQVLPWVAFYSGYSFLIVLLAQRLELTSSFDVGGGIAHIVLSINLLLSFLLIFRTNAAHDRYWEGRKLWGSLVNTTRNLARGISITIDRESSPIDSPIKEENMKLIDAFCVAMKIHLRQEEFVEEELMILMSNSRYRQLYKSGHPPLKIVFWLGEYLQEQYLLNRINLYQLNTLHKLLDDLVDILGGCERILKTPTPIVYSLFLKQLLVIYCLILPIELAVHFNFWTILIMALFSLILFGIEEIGSELENPFGRDPNDLPLDFICNTISGNIQELIKSNQARLTD